MGDGEKSALQLSSGTEQTNSAKIRGVQAGAVPCTGRGNLLALLSWEVGGVRQRLPALSVNPGLLGTADPLTT